jgi:hypothetical protein
MDRADDRISYNRQACMPPPGCNHWPGEIPVVMRELPVDRSELVSHEVACYYLFHVAELVYMLHI